MFSLVKLNVFTLLLLEQIYNHNKRAASKPCVACNPSCHAMLLAFGARPVAGGDSCFGSPTLKPQAVSMPSDSIPASGTEAAINL